jgi:putative transposase
VAQLKGLAQGLMDDYRVSISKACVTIMLHRSMWYYQPSKRCDTIVRMRMRELAMARVRYGFRRIFTLLRREGWKDNHKRVYRLYKLEGLNLRSKRPRRSRAGAHRIDKPKVEQINQVWSMDFMSDQLFDGKRFRILTLVDNHSRKCHALEVGQSLKGMDVVRIMNQVRQEYGNLPQRIQVDNGSEFISKDFDRWAYENGITLDYSRPGRPTDNPFIESFNGSFRDECLNTNWFLSLEDARDKIESFRRDYNEFRPHSSLQGKTPSQVEWEIQKDPEISTLELS